MKITCVADLHGYKPKLSGGDLLILAGDYTAADKLTQWAEFFRWLKEQSYDKKILIAGNHDNLFENGFPKNQKEADDLKEVIDFLDIGVDFEYLCDSGTEYKGLKIWGSPWSMKFYGMNPKCMNFTANSEFELLDKWKMIPKDIDLLITHTPPYVMLDMNVDGENCGNYELHKLLGAKILKPKLHIFGHIHEAYGQKKYHKTTFINCSYVNEKYKPVNKPIDIEI